MARRKTDGPRGLFDLASGRKHFRLSRYHASDELSFFIEHFWIVEWELPENRTYRQQSLPHPSVHIAFVGQTPDDWARSLGTGTTAEAATNVSSQSPRQAH